MEPISRHAGIAAPMPMTDVNTDLIYPQRFLRKPDRQAMGQFLFHSMRYAPDGAPDPAFVLNRRPYDRASILVAGRNFGSGSSREHAPWALRSFGFRCLVSSMFADIFKANCVNNGIITATVTEADLALCLAAAEDPSEAHLEVDLEARTIGHARLGTLLFDISDSDRERLLNGHDLIDEALREEEAIRRFESRSASETPWYDLGAWKS